MVQLQRYIPSGTCYRSRKRIYLRDDDEEEEISNNKLCCCLPTTTTTPTTVNHGNGHIRLFTGSSYYSRKPPLSTAFKVLNESRVPQSAISIEVLLAEQEEELDSYYSSPTEDLLDDTHYHYASKNNTLRSSLSEDYSTLTESPSSSTKAMKAFHLDDSIHVVEPHEEEDAKSLSEHRISVILANYRNSNESITDVKVSNNKAEMQRTSDILTTDSTLQEQELMDVSVSTQKDTLPLSSSPSSSSSSSTATTAAALAVEHEAFQSQQMLDPASLNIEQRHDDVRTTHEESDSVRLQTELTTNESQDNVNPIPVDDIKSDHGPKASGTARVDSMAKAAVVMMPQESRTIQQSAQSAQKQHLPPMTLVPVPRSSSLMSTSTTAFPATALPRTPLYPKKVDENSSKRQKDAAQQPCTEALVRNTVSEVEATAITASPSHPMSLVSQYASPTERAAMLDDQNILDTHTHSDNKQKTSLIASAQHLLLNDKTFIDEFTEKLSFIKKNIAIMNVHPSKNNKMESSADDQGRAVSSHHFNESLATVSSYSISNQDALEGDNDRYQQQSHHDENGPLSAFHEEEEEEEEEEDHTNIDEELIELSKKVVHNVRTLGEGLKTNGFRIFNNLSTRLKTLQKEYINNHPELNENNIAI